MTGQLTALSSPLGTTISTAEIEDLAVTTGKIAANAVDGTKIAFGSDAQGDTYTYDGTDVIRIAAGTANEIKETQGASANPRWRHRTLGAFGTFTHTTNASGSASLIGNREICVHATNSAGSTGLTRGNRTVTAGTAVFFENQNNANQVLDNRIALGFSDQNIDTVTGGNGCLWFYVDTTINGRVGASNTYANTTLTGGLAAGTRSWKRIIWTPATPDVTFAEQSTSTGQYVVLATVTTNVPAAGAVMNCVAQNRNEGTGTAFFNRIFQADGL